MLFAIFRFWFDCMFNLGSMQLFDVCGLFPVCSAATGDGRRKKESLLFPNKLEIESHGRAMWAIMIDGVNGRN